MKLKEIKFANLKFTSGIENDLGKLINVNYDNSILEFQTPKVIIEKLIRENNGKEYIIVKLVNCKSFKDKIIELENELSKYSNKNINSILLDSTLKLKVPFKYSKPIIKIYSENKLFNYYNLKPGMKIICLVSLNGIWINNYTNYNLNIKEILIIN